MSTLIKKSVLSAIHFVSNHGVAIELARLRYILYRQPVSAELRAQFRSTQLEDGGWQPFWTPGFSSLDASCFHLAQACQLGLEGSSLWHTTLHFLAVQQKEDGSWEENLPSGIEPPPWLMPGDEKGRLYLTANCAFWLSSANDASSAARKAACFLACRQGHDGRLDSFLQAHWLACAAWLRLGMQQESERTLEYLRKRMPELSPGEMVWMLSTLRISNLPYSHTFFQRAMRFLLAQQQPDGCWKSDDGEEFDVHTTLDALYAIIQPRQENAREP